MLFFQNLQKLIQLDLFYFFTRQVDLIYAPNNYKLSFLLTFEPNYYCIQILFRFDTSELERKIKMHSKHFEHFITLLLLKSTSICNLATLWKEDCFLYIYNIIIECKNHTFIVFHFSPALQVYKCLRRHTTSLNTFEQAGQRILCSTIDAFESLNPSSSVIEFSRPSSIMSPVVKLGVDLIEEIS